MKLEDNISKKYETAYLEETKSYNINKIPSLISELISKKYSLTNSLKKEYLLMEDSLKKKLSVKLSKMLPEGKIGEEIPWSSSAPNCMAFCYPQSGPSFILKGEFSEVCKKLDTQNNPMVVHFTIFKKMGVRKKLVKAYGIHTGFTVYLYPPTLTNPSTLKLDKHMRCWIQVKDITGKIIFLRSVHRLPRGWIKELDPYTISGESAMPGIPATPAPVPVPVPIVLTPEEQAKIEEERARIEAEKVAIHHSATTMASMLKRMGAIPSDSDSEIEEEVVI